MSTRESIRRELEELATLAKTMRTDPKLDARSSGEWSALDTWADDRVPTTPPQPRPSSVTVPPAVHSASPQAIPASLDDLAGRGRRTPAMGMAVAFLCAATTAATIAVSVSRSSPHAPASQGVRDPSPGPTLPNASPGAPALPSPASDEPSSRTDEPAPAGGSPSHVSTSRMAPPPKPAGASKATSPKLPPKAATATGSPSLDELMRKAVAAPPKK
jgi:hypothetical protein